MTGTERPSGEGLAAPAELPRRRWRLAVIFGCITVFLAGFGAGRLREVLPRTLAEAAEGKARQELVEQARAQYAQALAGQENGPQALSISPHTIDAYPALALRRHEEGAVVLELLIQPDGSVGDASVVQSSGHPQLDAAALIGVGDWYYIPAIRDHKPVPATIQVRIRFHLEPAR